MSKIEIKNRWTGSILFSYEKEDNTIRDTIRQAVASGADLGGADLQGADLRSADLQGANLRSADLQDAYLRSADLQGAYLGGANLRSADLQGADLGGANLRSVYLRSADLGGVNLQGAYLQGADLQGAYLQGADLGGANLEGADLGGANLRSADLQGAYLGGANLRSADLEPIKNDMFIVLLHAIPEIGALKKALLDGKIDGSVYDGDCKCLNGTLCHAAAYGEKDRVLSVRSSQRPIERFFLSIKPGDTHENNQFAKLAMDWIEEFETLIATK